MAKLEHVSEENGGQSTKCQTSSFFQQKWPASLYLLFTEKEGGTYLKRCQHKGPLYIQKPFYPEGNKCAHIYLLHPPGGLCSGDYLHTRVIAKKNANALITSPSAMRIYKARQAPHLITQPQRVNNNITIDKNSCIEWLPMETIIYPHANALLQTDISMNSNSIFIGWEIICLGLPASDLPFKFGKIQQHIKILIDKKYRIIDRFQLQQPSSIPTASAGLRHHHVTGLMLAGPFNQTPTNLIQQLRKLQQMYFVNIMVSITYVRQFLIFRYLGDNAFASREFFIFAWQLIRPTLCMREACPPAIWRT